MSLTRKFLQGFGLEDNVINSIIEAHTETTDALKEQRDGYKAEADKLPGVQAELETLKNKAAGEEPNEWQKKYEKEHSDFEAYKTSIQEKEVTKAKETAYRELLKAAGVAEKRIDTIMKVTSLDEIELDKDGKIKDSDSLTKSITETWADFITSEEKAGAKTKTPPEAGGGTTITKEQFAKMGYKSRMKLYKEDQATYEALANAKE